MKKCRFIIRLFLGILILLFCAVCVVWYLASPVSGNPEAPVVRVEVKEGLSARAVSVLLQKMHLIRSADLFYIYARHKGLVIKAGIYQISPAMTIPVIGEMLESGKQEYITLIVPEGLTVSKIAQLVEQLNVMSAAEFIGAAKRPELLNEYGIPAGSFEGYLFPDTYFLEPDMDPERLIRMMADNFFKHINEIEQAKGLSAQDLFSSVILASIVEREYRVADEAPLIASVFKNRISENIGLYSCATVEYIITEIRKLPHPEIITYEDLKDPSPYNTYKWAGLPPGPISNPGMVALRAVFDTPDTDYYFFRLIDEAEGRHHFSSSFDEHTATGRILYTKKAAGN